MVFRVRKLNSKAGELAWTVYYFLALQLGQEAGKTVSEWSERSLHGFLVGEPSWLYSHKV